MHSTNKWNDCLIKVLEYYFLLGFLPAPFNEFELANSFPLYPGVTAFLSHLLVIQWIDFCFPWVINPTGLERLQKGSHRGAFLMDSHREPPIHGANDIGLLGLGLQIGEGILTRVTKLE